MLELRKSQDRGFAQHGWLQSQHTFSFGYYRDPAHQGFSDLLVINEDRVAPGQGFARHGHRDMEIFSYVLSGALAHQDTLGNRAQINPGDVQLMSAGTGVEHSEFNASHQEPVHFLQIWIVPDQRGLPPGYQQTHFSAEQKRGALRLIISPDGGDGSLKIHQDARVFAALLDGTEELTYTLPADRFAYLHVARGSVVLNGQQLSAGDGVKVRTSTGGSEPGHATDSTATELHLNQAIDAEILLFDLRPKALPQYQ